MKKFVESIPNNFHWYALMFVFGMQFMVACIIAAAPIVIDIWHLMSK